MGFYSRFTWVEREELSRSLAAGMSLRATARKLGRHASTLSRELRRTGRSKVTYRALYIRPSRYRKWPWPSRRFIKLERNSRLKGYLHRALRRRWSPEQIARHLKKSYPTDTTMRLSHETIYQYLYVLPRGELKKELLRCLRHKPRHRRKRILIQQNRRHLISEMISIEERPPEVADRSVPGHWEGDLLVGPRHASCLGTLVERKTRLVLLVPLKDRDMVSVREAFAKAIRRVPSQLAKSLTYDQGTEMADHKRFTQATKMIVYFAHPHSPWERGTCENTNGLLRQFFPKETDFRKTDLKEIRKVERLMNGRPRKVLDWSSPSEAFRGLLR